ncbi:unnamed protein product, partial [Staurois parvus]
MTGARRFSHSGRTSYDVLPLKPRCSPISATCQCPSIPPASGHQCHLPVPISATSMPHISAHLSCLSVPPISASKCHLSVPVSATYQ